MGDSPAHLDGGGDMERGRDREPSIGMPRWVKVFLIIALALVLLFVVGKLTGVGGEHGPGRHGSGDDAPSSVVNEDGGHQPPVRHGA
jgi:hypothetical protein